MKIIIVGAGEVGRHVAKMLSRQEHNITIMDQSETRLEDLSANYDVMTKVGSPTSPSDIISCGVRECNLFIAVTPHESLNVTACLLASQLGAKKTVARIDNYEYLLPKNKELFKSMGINKLIYPEKLAAKEIVQSLTRSWVREYRSFCDEALIVVCVKVREGAEILNKEFKTGFFNHDKYRIVAIKRHNDTIIPGGNDQILAGDIVYFICSKDNLDFVRKQAGKIHHDITNIIIMGGTKIAMKTIQFLPPNINVKIIENDRDRCFKIADQTDTLIINGDGRNIDLLKEEGIEDADAFIAITDNYEANILACLAAKRFGVRKTIAEVENLDYIDLAYSLDIGTFINKKLIAAARIYQETLDESANDVHCLTYSDAEVVEFVAQEGDKITKSRVRDLKFPNNINIGGVIRDGKGYIVDGNTIIQPGDHVLIFCKASSMRKIASFF
ncbi:MAG: Trk system potassium transporter TrkA [bacterium]